MGKGDRPGLVAVSASTVADLKSYILDYRIADGDRIFDISRSGAFREIQNVYKASGVRMPSVVKDGVGLCHILRHSAAWRDWRSVATRGKFKRSYGIGHPA